MCIVILWLPGCDIINVEINLFAESSRFPPMTKKSRQKFKYLENENASKMDKKCSYFWRDLIEANFL